MLGIRGAFLFLAISSTVLAEPPVIISSCSILYDNTQIGLAKYLKRFGDQATGKNFLGFYKMAERDGCKWGNAKFFLKSDSFQTSGKACSARLILSMLPADGIPSEVTSVAFGGTTIEVLSVNTRDGNDGHFSSVYGYRIDLVLKQKATTGTWWALAAPHENPTSLAQGAITEKDRPIFESISDANRCARCHVSKTHPLKFMTDPSNGFDDSASVGEWFEENCAKAGSACSEMCSIVKLYFELNSQTR